MKAFFEANCFRVFNMWPMKRNCLLIDELFLFSSTHYKMIIISFQSQFQSVLNEYQYLYKRNLHKSSIEIEEEKIAYDCRLIKVFKVSVNKTPDTRIRLASSLTKEKKTEVEGEKPFEIF
jgi:hypothetical protein